MYTGIGNIRFKISKNLVPIPNSKLIRYILNFYLIENRKRSSKIKRIVKVEQGKVTIANIICNPQAMKANVTHPLVDLYILIITEKKF